MTTDKSREHGNTAAPEGVELVELHATAAAIESTWKAPPEVIAAIIEPMVEMLGDAPNYTESKLVIGKAGEPRYTLTVGRLWGKTPHELRREAEAERDRYRVALERIYRSGHDEHVEIAREALNNA